MASIETRLQALEAELNAAKDYMASLEARLRVLEAEDRERQFDAIGKLFSGPPSPKRQRCVHAPVLVPSASLKHEAATLDSIVARYCERDSDSDDSGLRRKRKKRGS